MKDPIKDSLDKIRLLESQQVDEYSVDQLGTDASAAARGFGHGLSFGFDDNIRAGLDRLTGQEKDYKTALQKQMAKTADLKAKASSAEFNNPFHDTWIGNKLGAEKTFKVSPYDAGELGGFAANTLIPGSIGAKAIGNAATKGIGKVASKGVANTVGKGVGTVGGLGVGLGANVGAAVGTGMAKNAIDSSVTGVGQQLVDRLARMNPEILKQLQSHLQVTPSGKIDTKTLNALSGLQLTESKRISILSELERINELAPGSGTAAKEIEKIAGNSTADATIQTLLSRLGVKNLNKAGDQEILTAVKQGFGPTRPPTTINAPTQFNPSAKPQFQLPPGARTEPRVQPRAEMPAPGNNAATGGTGVGPGAGTGGVAGGGNSGSTFRRRADRQGGGGGREGGGREGGGREGGGGGGNNNTATGGSGGAGGQVSSSGNQSVSLNFYGVTAREADQGLSQLGRTIERDSSIPASAATSLRAAQTAVRETGSVLPLRTWWQKWGGVVKYSTAVMAVIGATWLGAVLLNKDSSDGGSTTPQIGPDGGGGAGGGGAGGAGQVDPNDLEELHALMREIATYDDPESKALYAEYQELLANNSSLKPSSGSSTGPSTGGGSSTARDYGRDAVRLGRDVIGTGANTIRNYAGGAWDELVNPKNQD
jgi:hypothetical protein